MSKTILSDRAGPQRFAFNESQIYTTFHDRPEMCLAFADSAESGTEKAAKDALVQKIVDRANVHDDLIKALRNFVAFAEYHEIIKAFPRIQTQLLEMRAALAKAGAL